MIKSTIDCDNTIPDIRFNCIICINLCVLKNEAAFILYFVCNVLHGCDIYTVNGNGKGFTYEIILGMYKLYYLIRLR